MTKNTFANLSAFINHRRIELGWLDSISALANDRAVRTDWHHHSTAEMLFCIRGETHYEFRDGRTVALCAGSYLVIPARIEHRVTDAIDEPGKRIGLNLKSKIDHSNRFSVFTSKVYMSFLSKISDCASVARVCSPEMKRAIFEIDRLIHKNNITPAEYGYLRILCCTVLYAAVFPGKASPTPTAKIMADAVKWLEAHFSEKVAMNRLVAFMGYSRSRLFALFREHTGLTPNNYLLRLRINRAKEMLTGKSSSMQDIAAACGFSDAGYFSNVFKRQTGTTPLVYRKSAAAKSSQASTNGYSAWSLEG